MTDGRRRGQGVAHRILAIWPSSPGDVLITTSLKYVPTRASNGAVEVAP